MSRPSEKESFKKNHFLGVVLTTSFLAVVAVFAAGALSALVASQQDLASPLLHWVPHPVLAGASAFFAVP